MPGNSTSISVEKAKIILVEGSDDSAFLNALLKEMDINSIQIIDIGGVTNYQDRLMAIKQDRNFYKVTALGAIRDADSNPPASFTSIKTIIEKTFPIKLIEVNKLYGTNPKIGVHIIPSANEVGMLETICFTSVEKQPSHSCVLDLFKEIHKKEGDLPDNMAKARVQAYLSTRRRYTKDLGIAAERGEWQWDHQVFNEIKKFIRLIDS